MSSIQGPSLTSVRPITGRFATTALTLAATWALATPAAQANNGFNMPGYGTRALGMGGASIALPQDSLAAANNPAGMALVGDRFDVDLAVISADLDLDVAGNGYHDSPLPLVPEFGFNRRLSEDWTAGVSMISNGVELDYGEAVLGYGTTDLKSKLIQTIVHPTLTYRVAPGHHLGASLLLGAQRLRVSGVENLGLEDTEGDWATGYGAAFGYIGRLSPEWQVGATYRTPMRFSRFDDYRRLLPEGRINMPQQAGIGLAYTPTDRLTLALDVMWLGWSEEHTWGNAFTEGGALGDRNGSGFGWKDQRVVRFGASYDVTPRWTIRGGASFASELMSGSESTLSALAPLQGRDHYTLGTSYTFDNGIELNGAFVHMPKEHLHGDGASQGVDMSIGVDMLSLGIGVPL
ncbi:OmpP1/FadL family transporter [Larsenimonas suaedae]|uniref:Outer membrane protein transport protein n=1 Tax=Larsenimonas suaedae TaxID=1851019 RepID=A0ABU1GRY7_9GAMM|nr:outer membrane protein transport protein [Larsenimonas suaedae]MCM2972419.1 outer membrane protein transport protein [Larsenimonas suaedae]MDR5894785.1 outer membrane protein transport protein [Larsenimonas suaedae]